jgi:hypothetical protein
VKAAAAVLAASLLFFLGVLTGTGRRESVPPPGAIRLGVVDQPTSDGAGSQPPAADSGEPTATMPTPPTTGQTPASTPIPTGASTPPTSPTSAPTPPPTAPPTTATTARPGPVEEVDSEVDCSRGSGKAKGGREPCPTTTTTGRDGSRPGGGNNR